MTLEELREHYAENQEEEEEYDDDSSEPDWIMAANLLDDCANLLSFLGDQDNKKSVTKADRKKMGALATEVYNFLQKLEDDNVVEDEEKE